MSSRIRQPLRLLLAASIAAAVACTSACRKPTLVSDLVARFGDARKQPHTAAFDVADVTIGGVTKRSIIARGQTRLTLVVTVPRHAVLRTSIAVHPDVWEQPGDGVVLSVGVSDGHSFQTKASRWIDVFDRAVDRRWHDLSISLEEFAGLTISVFLNTRAGAAPDATVQNDLAVWGAPVLVAR